MDKMLLSTPQNLIPDKMILIAFTFNCFMVLGRMGCMQLVTEYYMNIFNLSLKADWDVLYEVLYTF